MEYTINKLGVIKIDGVVVDESDTTSAVYQRHEELLRSGLGPTPITEIELEVEIGLEKLKKRYSILISAIPGMQEGIEKVAFGEGPMPQELVDERAKLLQLYEDEKTNLLNLISPSKK
jgi:hypothetical protein